MSGKRLMVLIVTVAVLGAWLSSRTPSAPALASASTLASTDTSIPACPLPPRVARGASPLQGEVPAGMQPFALEGATVQPLASFSVDARVLGREDYRIGREADFSPVDFALGWGRMREDAVLASLDISQSARWYRYRWQGAPPIAPDEIARSSANMHMIPANDDVAAALDRIRRDDRVRIDGWLVQVDAEDGWRWRSSLTREDRGGGACELVYVCAVTRE